MNMLCGWLEMLNRHTANLCEQRLTVLGQSLDRRGKTQTGPENLLNCELFQQQTLNKHVDHLRCVCRMRRVRSLQEQFQSDVISGEKLIYSDDGRGEMCTFVKTEFS